jgi:hypothetical protein
VVDIFFGIFDKQSMETKGTKKMAKFDTATVTRWASMAETFLQRAGDPGTTKDIYLGAEAWAIAHLSGITGEAYTDRSVVDAHIVTALKQIFPNAIFKDHYAY